MHRSDPGGRSTGEGRAPFSPSLASPNVVGPNVVEPSVHTRSDVPTLAVRRQPTGAGGPGVCDALELGLAPATLVEALVTSTLDGIAIVSAEGRLLFMNAPGLGRIAARDFEAVRGQPWLDFWAGEQRARVATALATALGGLPNCLEAESGAREQGAGVRPKAWDEGVSEGAGDPRHWHLTFTPLRDAEGGVLAALIVSRDMTETVRAEARLREANRTIDLALAEARHRVKNLFALVPALLTLSARNEDSVPSLIDSVRERLAALGRSHALTLDASLKKDGVALDAVTRGVLEPYRRDDAFSIGGPPVRLAGGAANAVSLTLHELATNAAKYGALSTPNGRVALAWELDDGALVLRWTEAGGPPVAGSRRQGFGTGLLDRLVKSQGGEVSRDWAPDGLKVRLTVPLP